MSEAISDFMVKIASAEELRLAMTGINIYNAHILMVLYKNTVNGM